MEKNYLDLGGLERVADKVKAKEPLVFKGTQAEWDALTEEEKSNFELVCFSDDNGASGKDIYSTEEVKTNKVWIDGKPIYRRVIVLTNKTVGDGTELTTLTDYATLDYITYKYDAKMSNGTAWTTGFYSRIEEGGSGVLKTIYNPTNGKFTGVSSSRTFAEIYITIEYTKTTD